MSATDFVAPIISGLFGAGGAGAFVAYWREKKVAKAKGTVAEATVDIEVDTSRLALVEKQMGALAKSFDAERKALFSTIDHLKKDLQRELVESAKKDEKIAKLTLQVDEIQKALDLVKAELARNPTGPPN